MSLVIGSTLRLEYIVYMHLHCLLPTVHTRPGPGHWTIFQVTILRPSDCLCVCCFHSSISTTVVYVVSAYCYNCLFDWVFFVALVVLNQGYRKKLFWHCGPRGLDTEGGHCQGACLPQWCFMYHLKPVRQHRHLCGHASHERYPASNVEGSEINLHKPLQR